VFTKLAKLHAKTSFSFALVAGDLFAAPDTATEEEKQGLESLLNGDLQGGVPLPTYFTLGQRALPDAVIQRVEANDGEVCTNLYYLNKRSTTTTSEGVRIVALGGLLDAQIAAGESKDRFLPFHTESDARTLRGANRADILLTMHWPASIREGSKIALPEGATPPRSEQCIADLCVALRPRYHFSTSPEAFWEREPFVHLPTDAAPDSRPVTRFISLASSTAASKAKWLYAFTLDPKAPASSAPLPAGTTPSPFATPDRKRSHGSTSTARPAATTGMRNPKRRKKPQPPPGPGECFFCLANPNLSTHIITSIGEHAYLSTARGPLLEQNTYTALPFQSHNLIIPLSHAAALSAIPEPSEAEAVFDEMQRYRRALQSMVATKSAGSFGAVTWELSRTAGVHVHWQFLPLPRKLLDDGLAEAAFRVQAENAEYPAVETRDVGDGNGEGDYFRVWLWTPEDKAGEADGASPAAANGEATKPPPDYPGSETQLVLSLRDVSRFDVSFGRRVVAQLLEMEKRVDWKECVQSEEAETQEAEGFKEAFKAWDFALA
jgi:Protein similar to CwfJ C-terminus 1/Protein similar to CwfJ C-terminus 2